MKRNIQFFALATVLLTIGVQKGKAQNQFHMGQYMLHQPFINPAATGSYDQLTLALFTKKQWTGLNGAPFIGGVNLLGPLGKNSSIGGHVLFDKIGIDRFIEGGITYNYKFRVGLNNYISLGLTGFINTVQSNFSELTLIDAADPMFSANSPTYVMPNFKFGAYFFRKNFYIGFSTPNLLENKITVNGVDYDGATMFNGANIHYFLHSGYAFNLNEKLDLLTSVLIKQSVGAPMQFDINAMMQFKQRFGAGLSYRSSNELLIMLNYDLLPNNLKLGYAYEYNMGVIGSASSGSHEVILIYKFNPPAKPVVAIPRF